MAKSIIKRYQFVKRRQRRAFRKRYSSINFGQRNYSLYISRVLKEVVPMRGLSSNTVDIMNTLINDLFERIATEACQLMYFRKRCTLTLEDIQKAVYLLVPKKLAKSAVTFGSKAVHRFIHS
ncbi:histone H2B subacrosomal variant [Cricetulus griseus]|uniref:H2B.L histone variant 1 n=1 Tax=Cricetulus griseus TaxID=10029 RepID=G3IP44_CRIGR|nr:histone H2B subacrosomal variant [Cricetulus griseus]XP_027257029.1 histone H2B subacrosomal variant [Cricetulus griseus]EGV91545.1 Histone H2B subacrosomal variant [Cricetulus griseus]ERE84711.1 histone H2B subacrosomal variant-like protein [Cricetulus griseus]